MDVTFKMEVEVKFPTHYQIKYTLATENYFIHFEVLNDWQPFPTETSGGVNVMLPLLCVCIEHIKKAT